ncbi:glycine betaine ABC transporter substrate-binding protein [Tomitella gaofuii]|uniref:glycine betaine ABC transporter substrate-binding protein n=1 Tax=Tomitella gaofuii TaxID=2760083 RepID=UPI0015F968C0|nr:glycine betaine ABC transporter substrate-binding protein [Tomitella gaofuii]
MGAPDTGDRTGGRARRRNTDRRRRPRRVAGLVAALTTAALVAAGCGSGADTSVDEAHTVEIGYIDWAEDTALTALFDQQLSDSGYQVETTRFDDVGALFAAMADGKIDMFLDTWLPLTHQKYWDEYGDRLEDLGVWYDNANLELAVPSYVTDVNSIADLKDHAGEFGGVITGIEAGAGIMDRTEHHVIPDYGLGGVMRVEESSAEQMAADLGAAIAERRPIVVTLWHPHWAYSRYDLKDLKDPKGSLGSTENLHITARAGFSDDHPNLATVASGFTIDDERLQSLEAAINAAGADGEDAAVRQWRADNADYIRQEFGTLHQSDQRHIN